VFLYINNFQMYLIALSSSRHSINKCGTLAFGECSLVRPCIVILCCRLSILQIRELLLVGVDLVPYRKVISIDHFLGFHAHVLFEGLSLMSGRADTWAHRCFCNLVLSKVVLLGHHTHFVFLELLLVLLPLIHRLLVHLLLSLLHVCLLLRVHSLMLVTLCLHLLHHLL